VSSPELDPGQLAAILARKANEDAIALREFEGNPEIADSILGFHAQQAIEKWLKAVLAGNSVAYEYTHDLRRLIELLETTGITFPWTPVRLWCSRSSQCPSVTRTCSTRSRSTEAPPSRWSTKWERGRTTCSTQVFSKSFRRYPRLMAHHKRKRPKHRRSGCLLCKPHN
jgi:hypothetical protein